MKQRFVSLVIGTLTMSLVVSSASADNDLTGTWTGQITDPISGKHDIVLQLKTEGGKISGTLKGGPPRGAERPIEDARLDGDQLSFKVEAQGPAGEPVVLSYEGKVTGNHIQGTHEGPHLGSGPGKSVPWEVTKVAAPPVVLSESGAIAALKTELGEQAADGRFSGAVLIAKGWQAGLSGGIRLRRSREKNRKHGSNQIPLRLDGQDVYGPSCHAAGTGGQDQTG